MTLVLDPQTIIESADASTIPLPQDIPPGITGRLKRGCDIFIAVGAGIFLAPLMAVIAVLIKLQDGGPVLYRQTRCGFGGESFSCYKFRTMRVNADYILSDVINSNKQSQTEWQQTQKLKNDPRITPFGRFFRKSSLDELPQIFNILSGEMSVIGPRPVTYGELFRYSENLPYYTAARPGVTGLWQVNGRNNTTYEERIAFDITYVKTWSLSNDLKIMIKTVPTVLKSEGAY